MISHRLLTAIGLLMITVLACAPRQIRPIANIDPTPLLEAVADRNIEFEQGLSGTLEMDFKHGKKRFRGRAFTIAFPDGRFRFEVPGPLGSTFLIMTYNGHEVLAYYPDEGKAYRSVGDGSSINPYLPFPLPVEMSTLVSLLMGIPTEESVISETQAFLLESGEKQLWVRSGEEGLQFMYLFTKDPAVALRLVKARENSMTLVVTTRKVPPYFPDGFTLTLPDAELRGQWENVAFFDGDATVLQLNIPLSVHVTDLEGTF
jgi:hypothetical protein